MKSKTISDGSKGQFSIVPTREGGKYEQPRPRNRCALACASVSLILGVILAATGLAAFYFLPEYFESQVKQKAVLRPGTPTWESWQNPPLTVYSNFTFFHVENQEAVLAGEKPILKEVGPYVYKEITVRDILEEETEYGTIIFRKNVTYVFDAEKSAPLTESDIVTIVNPVSAAVGGKMLKQKKQNYWIFSMFEGSLPDYDDGVFVTKTVRELLLDGYESNGLQALQETGIPVPSTRFDGLLAKRPIGKNESYDGVIEIENGANGPEKIGQYVSWNGERQLDFWPDTDGTDACNKINGTDGTLFGPLTIKPDPEARLYVFITDLCRSLYLKYAGDVVHHGITTHRYTLTYEAVADPRENAEAECYCPEQADVKECSIRAAVIPKNKCQPGSPVIMSTPHFYLTNFEDYYTDFDGVMPQKELHETYLDLDPIVSVPISARKRLQVNLQIQPSYPLPSYANLAKDYVFPLMWIEQGADFPDEVADRLKSKVYTTKNMLSIGPWIVLGLGGVLIFGALIYLLRALNS